MTGGDFVTVLLIGMPYVLAFVTIGLAVYYAIQRDDAKAEAARLAEDNAELDAQLTRSETERLQWRAGAPTRRGQETAKRPGRFRVVDGGQ